MFWHVSEWNERLLERQEMELHDIQKSVLKVLLIVTLVNAALLRLSIVRYYDGTRRFGNSVYFHPQVNRVRGT
jgi:hypothetical protein